MSKSKLLGQFLQEKQPPFALEVYLHERTYHKTSTNSTLHNNPSKISKTSLKKKNKEEEKKKKKKKKRQNTIPNCSIFLKVLFGQIVSVKKIKNSTNGCQNSITPRRNLKMIEEDIGFHDDFLTEKQAKAERKLKCRQVEEHKQLSPVSVLIETESDDDVSPLHCKQCYISKTTKGESSTTTSQGKLKKPTYYNTVQRFQELVNSDSYGQYILNKKLLQQKKKLLIDYAREIVENQKKRVLRKILGADELWKLVCEDLWLWSQHTIDESNLIQLLHFDFLASEEEWSDGSEQQKKDIANQVGDAILDDIIKEFVL